MKEKTDGRDRRVTVYFTSEEYARLYEKFESTTHRNFSGYLRDLIHRKPVTVRYRNQSIDEFLPVAIGIKNELGTINSNLTRIINQLTSCQQAGQLKDILEYFAAEQFSLREKMEDIRQTLIKIYERWLQQ
jgi:hypothetical protein